MSTTTTTTCDRGDRYGPIEWAQSLVSKYDYSDISINLTCTLMLYRVISFFVCVYAWITKHCKAYQQIYLRMCKFLDQYVYLADKRLGIFTGWMLFLSPIQRVQSIDGKSDHWCQPWRIVRWRHSFFEYYETAPEGRGVTLWCQLSDSSALTNDHIITSGNIWMLSVGSRVAYEDATGQPQEWRKAETPRTSRIWSERWSITSWSYCSSITGTHVFMIVSFH